MTYNKKKQDKRQTCEPAKTLENTRTKNIFFGNTRWSNKVIDFEIYELGIFVCVVNLLIVKRACIYLFITCLNFYRDNVLV